MPRSQGEEHKWRDGDEGSFESRETQKSGTIRTQQAIISVTKEKSTVDRRRRLGDIGEVGQELAGTVRGVHD